MSKNVLDGNSLYLRSIPAYASNIAKTRGGLGGEITVPPNSLEFWNCTGNQIEVDGKSCIELSIDNKYTFDKKNLMEYMEMVHQEYISNVLQVYETYDRKSDSWKNVNSVGWEVRYQRIKKRTFKLDFDMYMKVTQDTDTSKAPRYYISSKGDDEYNFIIAYCLIPNFTNIRIEKKKARDGKCTFTFYLEAVGLDNAKAVVDMAHTKAESKNLEKSIDELYDSVSKKVKRGSSGKVTTTKIYDRDPVVSAYVKKRAEGKCDLCGKDAPFMDAKGNPYLEEHHVERLADGGDDTIDNAVALCPNCHRQVHIVGTDEIKTALINRLMAYAEIELKLHGSTDSDKEK